MGNHFTCLEKYLNGHFAIETVTKHLQTSEMVTFGKPVLRSLLMHQITSIQDKFEALPTFN